MRGRNDGVTLIELVLALALMGIIFAVLASVQLRSVQASAMSRDSTLLKTEANRVLERMVFKTTRRKPDSTPSDYSDDTYYYDDFVAACAEDGCDKTALDEANLTIDGIAPSDHVDISMWIEVPSPGSFDPDGDGIGFTMQDTGGILLLSVRATHTVRGTSVTLGSAISCYDVFPTPVATAPDPCPDAGGGS